MKTAMEMILDKVEYGLEFHTKVKESSLTPSYHDGVIVYLLELKRVIVGTALQYERDELVAMCKIGSENPGIDGEEVFNTRYKKQTKI